MSGSPAGHKCGEPIQGRERAEDAGYQCVTCHHGITLGPVAMVVPEKVDQDARGPEYGNEAGEPARSQLTSHECVVRSPGHRSEADYAEQNVEPVHPENLLIEARELCQVLLPAQTGRRLQAGYKYNQV